VRGNASHIGREAVSESGQVFTLGSWPDPTDTSRLGRPRRSQAVPLFPLFPLFQGRTANSVRSRLAVPTEDDWK